MARLDVRIGVIGRQTTDTSRNELAVSVIDAFDEAVRNGTERNIPF
jgi:hypothetical protein